MNTLLQNTFKVKGRCATQTDLSLSIKRRSPQLDFDRNDGNSHHPCLFDTKLRILNDAFSLSSLRVGCASGAITCSRSGQRLILRQQ